MKKTYNLGFIGGSMKSVVGYTHFTASRLDNRFKVISGVFSRDSKVNAHTGDYWGVPTVYSSIEEMIDKHDAQLDAVAVLLPTPDHMGTIEMLLERDIAVICDKPLVSNLTEIDKLMKYDFAKKFLVTTYNYNGFHMVRELKKMIASDKLGDILTVHMEMPQESFLRPPKSVNYPPEWRKYDREIPTISLDLLSHLYSMSYYLTGKEIKKVNSSMKKYSKFNVVDDVKVMLDYDDGSSGMMWVSKIALGNRNGLTINIHGSKASAKWVQEEPEKLYVCYDNGQRCVIDRANNLSISNSRIYNRMIPGHPSGFIEAFANCYYSIAEALTDFKHGKDYNSNPDIWNIENERKSILFQHAVVKSSVEDKSIIL